jgi:hypothetical protein
VKNTFRALTFIGAVALLLSLLVSGSSTVAGAELADVQFRSGPDLDSSKVEFGTNDTSTPSGVDGSNVAVHVIDDTEGAVPDVKVRITSGSDSQGFDLTLTREGTSATTSTYIGALRLGTMSTSSPPVGAPMIKVKHGDTVTASYTDTGTDFGGDVGVIAALTVDTKGPVFSGLSPAGGTITKTPAQIYAVTAKDRDSGIDETRGTFGFRISSAGPILPPNVQVPLLKTDAKEGGEKVGITFSIPLSLTGTIYISALAQDKAGNVGVLDADPEQEGPEPAKVIVDVEAPLLGNMYTGVGYDATKPRSLTANKRDGILIQFTDALTDLDPNTISSEDFSVAGHSVSGADIFAPDMASSTALALTVDVGKAVFLTLADDLGPGDRPAVTVIGQVADRAGNNHISVAAKKPFDKIAPSFTVSDITPTLAGKGDTVTFTIAADEPLSTDSPATVLVTNLEDSTTLTRRVTSSGTNRWEVKTGKVSKSATYSIYVGGTDAQGNQGTVGDSGNSTTTVGSTKIIEFEADVSLQAPGVTPANEAKPTTRDPFYITIDFGATTNSDGVAESNEFVGDSSKTVTLTKVELDGEDVSGGVATEDDIKFLLAVTGITSEEHTLVFNAKDQAGNDLSSDMTVKFEVKDRPKFSISLQPGWNLISLPSDPEDLAINAVFESAPDVSDVITYEPITPGGGLSATRDEDAGTLVGTLETIDSTKGYWVNSTKFQKLEVVLKTLQAGQVVSLPPSLRIVAGWNLVPVVDVTGTKASGDTVAASEYLRSLSGVTRVYTFVTILNQWTLVDHEEDDLSYGMAYYLYSTKKDNLVP